MATPAHKPTIHERKRLIAEERENRRPHFDVTCTIGRVFLDGDGDQTPFEAAMLLIARHDADGTFRFPAPNGDTTVVTVATEPREEV